MNKISIKKFMNQSKWVLLGGGPLFFLVRALYFVITGGDTFSKINPIFSWFLLYSEILLSAIAASIGIIGLVSWKKELNQLKLLSKRNLKMTLIFAGISTYIVHFIRVAIWLSL